MGKSARALDESTTASATDETTDNVRPTRSRVSKLVEKMFRSCEEDPKGSIHKAWGISLIFIFLFFIVAVVEMLNLNAYGGSRLMIFASIWVGLVHIGLAILGTFVLRRFPTSFAIGFFLGILVVLANQNLMLFGVFRNYSFGNGRKNHAFANMAFTLFAVLSLFTTLLANFRHELVVAAVDVKGIGRRQNARGEEDDNDEYQYQDERH